MCVSKIGKTGEIQTGELQGDTQGAKIMKRSGSTTTIGTNPDKRTDSEIPPTTSQTKIDTEISFSNANTIHKQVLGQRFDDVYSEHTEHNIETSIPPLQAKISPLKSDLKPEDLILELPTETLDKLNLPKEIHIPEAPPFTPYKKIFKVDVKDSEVLKITKDDAKQVTHEDNSKIFTENIQEGVSKLVKDLDSTSLKDSVYKKAEAFGKSIVENMDPKGMLALDFTLKTPEEVKHDVVTLVFGLKEKYNVPFQKAMDTYNHKEITLKNELRELRSQYLELNGADPQKMESLKQVYLQKYLELRPDPPKSHIDKINQAGFLANSTIETTFVEKPKLYDFLPKNKQVLVDKIIDGMNSGSQTNKVNQLLDKTALPGDQQVRLKKYLEQSAFGQGGILNPTVDIPTSIEFNGKKYDFDKLLGGGGEGIAFLMKSTDGEKVVVKGSVYESGDKNYAAEMNKKLKKEVLSHIAASGNGNDNILGFKGVLRSENSLLTVTEFAKGGELNDVVDNVRTAPISDGNKNVLKLFMAKQAVQGLQFLQTERNMSHYDVKPKNFFVGENGQVKLADFGRAGLGHKVHHEGGTPIYNSPEVKTNPTEKVDTYAMGISLDSILNNVNYGDFSVNYARKENNPLNKLISGMTSENPENRPTLTAVLQHSTFDNPVMNDPGVKEISGKLLDAIMEGNHEEINKLNNELEVSINKVSPPLTQETKTEVNQGNVSFKDELKQAVKANKKEYIGSTLETLDNSVNEKQFESTKSLLNEEKVIANDKEVLSETTYTDKPQTEQIKDISNQDIQKFVKEFNVNGKELTSLVGDLDKALNKDKVYTNAKEMGKSITTGLDPEMTMGIKLRSDSELKEIVANSIAIKDKYHESHSKALSKYSEGMGKLGPLAVKYNDINNNDTMSKQEKKVAIFDINKQMYDIGKEYNLLKSLPEKRGDTVKIENIKNPPSMYKMLPENKQKLVTSIVEGMKSGIPEQASKENVTFGEHVGDDGQKSIINAPKSITLNNKTYISPDYIAKGGLAAVFKYVNQDDPNDTVVVKNPLNSAKRDEMVTEIKNHLHALDGQDNNPDVINLKGIVKGNGTELYMVMETAKGDTLDVFGKVDELKNIISPKTGNILKTLLSKDMMQSMLYIQKDRNMIHLDLKPNNFLMNSEGKAVIADFGTSRRTQEAFNLSFDSQNPTYASPEALSRNLKDNDEKLLITEKSDIWSLGLTLHDVNYGATKLEHKTFSSVTERNIVNFSKNDNNRLIDNEATGLDRVINSMTHPDPNQRPTLEGVLKSSLFTDPNLDKPEVRELIKELTLNPPDLEKIKMLSNVIDS